MRCAIALLTVAAAAAPARADLPFDFTKHGIVYRVPGMDAVKIRRDVALAGAPKLDLYLPAAPRPGKLPVVVFVNGVGDSPRDKLKDWEIYRDWARVIAARGYAAIVHEADGAHARQDLVNLLARLRSDGASLGLDADRIALWACSANVTQALPVLMDDAPRGVRAAVIYYGTGAPKQLRKDLPVFWIMAGQDNQGLVRGQRALWARAIEEGVPWTMIHAPAMPHAFDAFDTSEDSRRLVGQTLAFFDAQLGTLPAAPPPSASREILADMYGTRYAAAATKLEAFVAAHPRDLEALATLSNAYRFSGRDALAVATFQRLLAIDPGNVPAARQLVIAGAQRGDCKGSAPWIAKLGSTVTDTAYRAAVATCDLIEGRRDAWRKTFDAAIAAGGNAGLLYYNLACSLALAGKRDDALAMLEKAVASGWTDRQHLANDPDLTSLRDSPRFKALAPPK